jgi:hypothetical protein
VRAARFLNFQQITMPYLAARVPPEWRVTHIDEEAEEIDPLRHGPTLQESSFQ